MMRLLIVFLFLPSKVLDDIVFVFLALAFAVEVYLLELRSTGHCRVKPLPRYVRKLVVEDGDGLLVLPWKECRSGSS